MKFYLVHWLAISSILEKPEGTTGKAVATVEAKFTEERNSLQVDNHVLDKFELANHGLLLVTVLFSAQARVNVRVEDLELAENFVVFVLLDNGRGVEVLEASLKTIWHLFVLIATKFAVSSKLVVLNLCRVGK